MGKHGGGRLTDLKLIDELLCDIKSRDELTWAQMETQSSATAEAMVRLRQVWASGSLRVLTLSLAQYFSDTEEGKGHG